MSRENATKFLIQGIAAAQDKSNPTNLQVAYQLFCAAAFEDPTFAEAWYQLGCAHYDMNLLPAALAAWRRAEPYAEGNLRARVLGNIGWALHSLGGRTNEALRILESAIGTDPSLGKAWFSLSCVYRDLNEPEKALDAARKAKEFDPDSLESEMALAFANLFARRWADGLRHFEARFPYKLHNYLKFPYPKWEGEEGVTLFLSADQGLGDTLSYSRFLERAAKRAKHIYALIQPALMRLFTYTFTHLQNVTFLPDPSPFPPADAWSTFVSLPFALGLSDREIEGQRGPPLPAFDPPSDWKVRGPLLHIGIAWAGSPLNDIDKWRSIPLAEFLELYRVRGIQLYSMQIGPRVEDLHKSGAGGLIRDLSPWISDVMDTASLLGHLDLVITCESALGHIAGAIDKECWIPYSWNGRDYRLGPTGAKPLWYKKHRVFPQGPDAEWGSVFSKIRRELEAQVAQATKVAA